METAQEFLLGGKEETARGFLLGRESQIVSEIVDYGLRGDKTKKGPGFLGELKRPDGKVSTELSIGVNFGGKEIEIPSLVPTLTQDEINYLLRSGEPTKEIVNKSVEHARGRMAEGKNPFKEWGEKSKLQPIFQPIPPVIEPPPFDIDKQVLDWVLTQPEEKQPELREGIARTFAPMIRPWLAQGYNSASALNRGLSVFSEHLDTISGWLESKGLGKKEGIFKSIANNYDTYSDYWKDRANKVGINFVDELVSEAVGGAIPGITEFILNIPYAGLLGAAKAKERGENELLGALVEGGKRGVLGGIFKAMGPLKQYLRSPAMGTVFGIQTAGEGGEPREIAKSVGAGVLYSLSSPGGQIGLNELRGRIERQIPKPNIPIPEKNVLQIDPKVKEIIESKPRMVEPEAKVLAPEVKPTEIPPEAKVEVPITERGLLEEFPKREGEPEIRERKYWKTVEEAERTAEGAKFVMEEIQKEEPQINIVEPNRASLEKAYITLEEKGFEDTLKYTYESKELKPVEKGALFNVLMEQSQKIGDWAKFTEIMDSYSLYLVDLGRGVQIASVWNRATPQGFIKWAEKQLDAVNKKYGWFDTILGRKKPVLTDQDKIFMVQELSRIQKIPESIEKSNEMLKLIDFVAVKVPPSVNELIDAYRYSNMLSGPQTQERNIGYNMTTTFFTRPYEIGIRGMIDYVQSGLRGKEREAYISDVATYYKHAFNAIPDALMAFKNAWQMKPGEVMGKPEIGIEYKTPFEQARAKQMPKVLTIVQRFMEGSDKFNSAIIGAGEYAIQKEKGLSDIEAHEKARNLAENYLLRDKLDPTDPSLSYFSEALSGLGKMIEYGRKTPVAGRVLSWFVPFLRTPINLGIQMVERSPVGWARSNIDLESASKLAGGAVFTGIGALFAYLGETTWAPPSGAEEKEWFYASGRKPFSVKVGEKWVPLWYLGPFALAFGIPAAVKYYTEESKQSLTDSTIEEIGKIAMGIGRFIGSQTSAQSIGNFFSLMAGDIDFTFVNQIGFMLGQAIPAEAMIRYINKAIDPVYRKAEGVWEQVIKDIPFLSKELPARKTPFMEESKRDFFNLFVPYDIGISKEEYESMYPFIKMEQRENYLNNKMNELIKKMGEGEFKDKHFDEMIKIFEATPKVFEENILK